MSFQLCLVRRAFLLDVESFVFFDRLNMAMNEDRLYVLSANPHYAIPEESAYFY